jgi:hypothetical protein
VNLDTNTAISFISEGSPIRHHLKHLVRGRPMILTETARAELQIILNGSAGPLERARAQRLLERINVVRDKPSARARQLTPTRNIDINDIVILGTGDELGVPTLTADRRAVRSASAQGVDFDVVLHTPVPLRGL